MDPLQLEQGDMKNRQGYLVTIPVYQGNPSAFGLERDMAHFLSECSQKFGVKTDLKYTFLANGNFVKELSRIPKNEVNIFVSIYPYLRQQR